MKNSLHIIGGVIGAVAGFLATLLALELVGFGNPADPITSALLTLLVFAPAGAIAGLVIGTWLGMRWRGAKNAGGLAVNSLKSFGVVAGARAPLRAARITGTRSPPPRPGSTRMPPPRFCSSRFASPRARHCRPPRKTSRSNCRPTRTACRASRGSSQFRRDGDRAVIAGDVELAFRTALSPAGDQDQGPARSRVPHRTIRQGAACP